MKSRPGQGLTEISKKIRLKQNDHASRRTQRSPHTRREQHRPSPSPTLAASTTLQALAPHSPHAPPPPASRRPAPATPPPRIQASGTSPSHDPRESYPGSSTAASDPARLADPPRDRPSAAPSRRPRNGAWRRLRA